jgi:membrane protein DedA with SNARE-associated domain
MDALNDLLARIAEIVDSLVALVTDSPLTYLVILLLTAVDPILPIIPAEAVVTAAAVLAGQGQLNVAWVMLAAGLGAFLGDNIVYWIGRVAGRPIITRVLRGRADQLESAERQFERRGGILIIVGRFVPGGRTLTSMSAGALGFGWPRFLAWDALAAVIWAIQAALPGYIGGVVVADRPWLAMIVGFALSLGLAAALAVGQQWWQRRDRDVEGPPVTPGSVGQAAEDAAAAPKHGDP